MQTNIKSIKPLTSKLLYIHMIMRIIDALCSTPSAADYPLHRQRVGKKRARRSERHTSDKCTVVSVMSRLLRISNSLLIQLHPQDQYLISGQSISSTAIAMLLLGIVCDWYSSVPYIFTSVQLSFYHLSQCLFICTGKLMLSFFKANHSKFSSKLAADKL